MSTTNPKEFLSLLCQRPTLLSYRNLVSSVDRQSVSAVDRQSVKRFLQLLNPFTIHFYFLILTLVAVYED